MKKTNFLKAVAFTMIICILVSYATNVLKLKKVTVDDTANTYIQEGIYELEKNSIELCFLGNSQMVYGVSGMMLLKEYGISSYNAATSLQSFFLNLFNLKELQKTQDIKTVVLDMGSIDRNTADARTRMVLDNAPLSINKLKTIWEYCQTDEHAGDIWTYIFPIMKYHSRWNALNSSDFSYKNANTHVFRGNILSSDIYPIERSRIIADDDEGINPNSTLNAMQLKYFRELVVYCKENNINLVLIKTPKADWDKASMLNTQALADEYDLDYLDFNTTALLEETGISTETDFKDEDHLNTHGVEKLTNYLGEYLSSHYEFTDYRESELYSKKTMEAFERDLRRNLLKLARTPETAFDIVSQDEQYEILIEKTGEISAYWTKEIQNILESFGLNQNIADLTNKNFVAYLSGGKSIYEASDTIALEYKIKSAEGKTTYVLKSDYLIHDEITNTVTPMVNTTGLPVGINISIYDTTYHEVVRSFTLYGDPATNSLCMQ